MAAKCRLGRISSFQQALSVVAAASACTFSVRCPSRRPQSCCALSPERRISSAWKETVSTQPPVSKSANGRDGNSPYLRKTRPVTWLSATTPGKNVASVGSICTAMCRISSGENDLPSDALAAATTAAISALDDPMPFPLGSSLVSSIPQGKVPCPKVFSVSSNARRAFSPNPRSPCNSPDTRTLV